MKKHHSIGKDLMGCPVRNQSVRISWKRKASSAINMIALALMSGINTYLIVSIFLLGLEPESVELNAEIKELGSYMLYVTTGYFTLYFATPNCRFKSRLRQLIN